MRRGILFFIKLAIVIAVAVWLAERPGQVEIEWQGYIVETTVGILILAVGLLVVAAALLYRFWSSIVRAPRRFARAREAARRERGYRALTYGLVSVAAGDPDAARRYARRADGLLNEPPLTMLLSAQAAQLNGDENAARNYFEAMLKRPETEFLGIRGLLTQALRRDDTVKALSLVQRARQISPRTPWVLRTCFDLEVRQRRWADAQRTLTEAVRAKAVDAETGRRNEAALLIERSREAETAGQFAVALDHARRARRLAPASVPAAVREAHLLNQLGRPRPASRVIERAWARTPHRDLFDAFMSLLPAAAEPLARVKQAERLFRVHPGLPDSLIGMAEAELRADLWGTARGHLLQAEAKAPSRRVYRLLADLEQSEHGDAAAARNWLAKAANAEPDPAWTCADCGASFDLWTALCANCSAFDTLEWRVPSRAVHLPHPASTGLPLLAPSEADRGLVPFATSEHAA